MLRSLFAYYLSPFRFVLLALAFFAASSCKLNPDLQGNGEKYLQGEWQQDNVPMQQRLMSYSLYDFKFNCDSFFVKIRSFSRINYGADTCMNSGHWVEYTKGTYDQKNDTLHLKGQFCNANHSLKSEGGCFRSGVYEDFFKVRKKTDSLLQFSSTSTVIPIKTHLIKRTSCSPKPL